jgi:endonuclease YncB( thermonuclease family)
MWKPMFTVALLSILAFSARADVTGKPRVIDGDTVAIGEQVIRFFGIDAPEMAQRCDGPKPLRKCGEVAADALAERVSGKTLTCEGEAVDKYKRLIATCQVDGADLSAWMVSEGYALAYVKYSDRYAGHEAEAKAKRKGLWETTFEPPWEYRAARWKVAVQEAPKGCPIKGNISLEGKRIYHTPWGSRHYGRTKINVSKGERWFCSEREALDAGWRAPLR